MSTLTKGAGVVVVTSSLMALGVVVTVFRRNGFLDKTVLLSIGPSCASAAPKYNKRVLKLENQTKIRPVKQPVPAF